MPNKDGHEPGRQLSMSDIIAMRPKKAGSHDAPTRESIAKMKRGDVVDLLEGHGISEAECEGERVGDLRDLLISVMFVDA